MPDERYVIDVLVFFSVDKLSGIFVILFSCELLQELSKLHLCLAFK